MVSKFDSAKVGPHFRFVRAASHPELRQCRADENKALEAMFSGMDNTQLPRMAWEEKHPFHRAQENERFYLQGMKDGAQLIFSLLSVSFVSSEEEANPGPQSKNDSVKPGQEQSG